MDAALLVSDPPLPKYGKRVAGQEIVDVSSSFGAVEANP